MIAFLGMSCAVSREHYRNPCGLDSCGLSSCFRTDEAGPAKRSAQLPIESKSGIAMLVPPGCRAEKRSPIEVECSSAWCFLSGGRLPAGDIVSGASDYFQDSAGGCGLGDPCLRFMPEAGRKPALMIN